ncbi:hypothetical protein [Fibrobacter sp. UWH4]|uniref:hypothetical protein n=1 Tax=Fibrobacter sp. UWH4 TaxID=1896210 RepID=UPI00090F84C0|nr:hypothetical protein [Fibrobacter sp. UWH4]SHK87513.1 hypothetical protein SAMN05720762_103283 [Fibrobacter sp. UWH4]
MTKLQKKAANIRLWAIAPTVALVLSACGTFWAGGVDEEQNTIAGAAEENNLPASSSEMISQPDSESSSSFSTPADPSAPTSSELEQGTAIVFPDPIIRISSSSYTIPVSSTATSEPELGKHEFTGIIRNNGNPLDLSLNVDGNFISTTTDLNGKFTFENVPEGTHVLYTTKDGTVGDVAFLLLNNGNGCSLLGPIPASESENLTATDLTAPPMQTIIPDAGGTDLPDSLPSLDGNGKNDTVVYHSGNDINCYSVREMPHEPDYGHVCAWDEASQNGTATSECDLTANPEAITIEANVIIGSLDPESSYRLNIVSKQWEKTSGVFSLAVINNDCGVTKPSLAFFASNGSAYSCDNALISGVTVETGVPLALTAVWNGTSLWLYKNGFPVAFRIGSVDLSNVVNAPVVFGDEEGTVTLNSVQLGNKAIFSADVLYRYYLNGGEQ